MDALVPIWLLLIFTITGCFVALTVGLFILITRLGQINRNLDKLLSQKTSLLNEQQISSQEKEIDGKEEVPTVLTAFDICKSTFTNQKSEDSSTNDAIPDNEITPPALPITPVPEQPAEEIAFSIQQTSDKNQQNDNENGDKKEEVPPKDPYEVAMEDEPAPKTPSIFAQRIQALRNWFIYGKGSGVQPGEAIEKLLATTWLLRGGILVILFTTAFLLKLSIDRGLLAPEGRVALSYLSGAALLVAGMNKRMKERYWSLGQALIGIGLAIFYFSSFALVSIYHLTPPLVGGVIMLLTTVTAGWLAHRQNSIAVALVALLGGYATPLLLNTGAKNFPGLTGYLLLLGAGVLWLAAKRNWPQINWLGMLFSYAIYWIACSKYFMATDFAACQISFVLLMMLFSTSVFIHNVFRKIEATALEILALLVNSGLFFSMSIALISKINHGDRLYFAPLTLGLACYYLLHAVGLGQRKQSCDRNLLLIFCALSGFYLAFTFPVVLTGDWLPVAWSLQATMMLWLGLKMDSKLLKNCAWVLYMLTLVRLGGWAIPGYSQLQHDSFWAFSMERCIQFLIPVISLAYAAKLMSSVEPKEYFQTDEKDSANDNNHSNARNTTTDILASLAFLVLCLFMRLEINVELGISLHPAAITFIWAGAACCALLCYRRCIPGYWHIFSIILISLVFISMVRDYFTVYQQDSLYLNPDMSYSLLWSRWFAIMLNTVFLVAGLLGVSRLLKGSGIENRLRKICQIAWPIMLFLHTTYELQLIIKYKLPGLTGGGISVLWALFAFALIWNGLRKAIPALRYLGLGMFLIVVCKVFLWDMRHLDAIYRVIAFLLFGILLIGAAFIYLKFWKKREDVQND